ncbi:hypothetical protein B0H14DRAFT_2331711, partial [Mycena olivaceomarginata]
VYQKQVVEPIANGGKNTACLKDRNKAINLKLLQRYLNFGLSRPTWAAFTDRVFSNFAQGSPVVAPEALINPFLQTCSLLILSLREPCKTLHKTAREFDVRLDGLHIDIELLKQMPVWFHIGASPDLI